MSVTVTLCYDGREYTFVDAYDYEPWFHGDGSVARTAFEVAEYIYTEGNYGCDCNRSAFLADHCGVDFSGDTRAISDADGEWSLGCGREIKLVALDDVRYFYDESIGCEERVEYKKPVVAAVEYVQQASGLYVPVLAGKEQEG